MPDAKSVEGSQRPLMRKRIIRKPGEAGPPTSFPMAPADRADSDPGRPNRSRPPPSARRRPARRPPRPARRRGPARRPLPHADAEALQLWRRKRASTSTPA